MKFLVAFLFFLSAIRLNGQCDITISGKVNDKHDNEPLAFATITLVESQQQSVADENGNFRIDKICPSEIHLKVDHIGCEAIHLNFVLTKDTFINLALEHHAHLLQEINIEEDRLKNNATKSKYSISGDEIDKLSSQSISELASKVAGVSILKTGNNISKPLIQGFTSNRISIINDGTILESQQWGLDHAPEIDATNVTKLTVIKGSAPIYYGTQAMAGAIITESTIQNIDRHLHGSIKYSGQSNGRSNQLSTNLTKSLNNLKLQGSTFYKIQGDQSTPNYFLSNTGAREVGLNASLDFLKNDQVVKLGYKLYSNKLAILRGSHIGNTTDLKLALDRDIPFFTDEDFTYQIQVPNQQVSHQTAFLTFAKEYNNGGSLALKSNFQYNRRKEFDVRRGNRSDKPVVDLTLYAQSLNGQYTLPLNDKVDLSTGLDWKYLDNDNVPGTSTLPLIPDYISHVFSAFTALDINACTSIKISLGARYEYNDLFANRILNRLVVKTDRIFHGLALNSGLHYKITDYQKINIDLSYIHRPPQINELFSNGLHQSVAAIEQGNPDLGIERSTKLVVDYSTSMDRYGDFSLDLYAHWIDDFIYLTPTGQEDLTIRGAFFRYAYVNGRAWVRGADLMYNLPLGTNSNLQLQSSIIRSTDLDRDKEISFTPPPMIKMSIERDMYLTSSKRNTISFLLSGEHNFRQSQIEAEDDFALPPSAYNLFHFEASTKHLIGSKTMTARLTVKNVLNTSYRNYLNRFRYFADDLGRSIDLNISYTF
jgi:iron complex outermembrane recepter protein